ASDAEHVGAYYTPVRQEANGYFALVARARDGFDAAALTPNVRAIVGRLDPDLALFDVQTMDERLANSLVDRRTPMTLLLVFAGVALFLAVIGIYGALAYAVARRRREMGIRMALGSGPREIFRLILGDGLRVTTIGLALGLGASGALAGLVSSFLFGVR